MDPILRNLPQTDWMTLTLVLGLAILVMNRYFFSPFFFNYLVLPFNNRYIALNKQKGKVVQAFHFSMGVFQLINLSLFIFIAQNVYKKQGFASHSEVFALIVIGMLLYLFIKMAVQLGNAYFFDNEPLMMELIFEKSSYFNYGGFIAFFGNILMIYIFQDSLALIYVIFILLLVINGIGIIKILRNHQKLFFNNTFYFILYLCALEISPIAIILSYLNR